MKKLGLLLVLVLLVVPAFAANISTSSWIGVGFHTRLLPFPEYGLAWGTWGSGNISYSLSGSSNLGSVNAGINIDVPVGALVDQWISGTITFSKVAGMLDLSFHKGTLGVDSARLLVSGFDGSGTGIKAVVGVAPLKVTVGYAPADSWWKSDFLTDAALAVRGDVSLSAPLAVSAYGLVTKATATTAINYAVGASATPISTPVSLTVYGEVASSDQLVGATVKALGGKVTVDGNYKLQSQGIFLSATVDGIVPNLKAYVEYNTAETYTIYGYVSASAPVPVGSLSLGGAVASGSDTLFGGFALWSVSLGGGVSHDLLLGYGFDWDDYSSNGWYRGNLTLADNLWGADVKGKFYAESKLMIGF